MFKSDLYFDGLRPSACSDGIVVQDILERKEESSSQNALTDFRDDSWTPLVHSTTVLQITHPYTGHYNPHP